MLAIPFERGFLHLRQHAKTERRRPRATARERDGYQQGRIVAWTRSGARLQLGGAQGLVDPGAHAGTAAQGQQQQIEKMANEDVHGVISLASALSSDHRPHR